MIGNNLVHRWKADSRPKRAAEKIRLSCCGSNWRAAVARIETLEQRVSELGNASATRTGGKRKAPNP